MSNFLIVVTQTLSILAVLVGVALLLPLAVWLIVDGVIVLSVSIAVELITSRKEVT